MPRSAKSSGSPDGEPIEQYEHTDKTRLNNPPVGLVTVASDATAAPKQYSYDPHLDPQLIWAGKAERTSFEVPTVSLHVHERIDPLTIINAVRKDDGSPEYVQGSLFEQPRERPPLRQALDFYKHQHGWSNRLIAGDSLLVMNSLLEKEGLAGQVQMIYIDPPYGVKYRSNFQPFVNQRDVQDGKDEDLTQEPEMIRAFRDTWELGIHSYLSYLRDRLLLARELLSESGSCFVQISDENVHRVRTLMEEIFGSANFVSLISYQTAVSAGASTLDTICDYILWYARDKERIKFRRLFQPLVPGEEGATRFTHVESPDGKKQRTLTPAERRDPALIPSGWRLFTDQGLTSRGAGSINSATMAAFPFEGEDFRPTAGHWRTGIEGLAVLATQGRILRAGKTLRFKKYFDDFPYLALTNMWTDTGGGIQSRSDPKIYVVQTTNKVIQRCLLMTSDPGDLILDPTCGSGTTAFVAEQWGRRWMTCDTSRVAITLAKQRLMAAVFEYYELSRPEEGVGSGFKYTTLPHIQLESIAYAEPPVVETLYTHPLRDTSKARLTGPFTLEAVPAPAVKSLDGLETGSHTRDASVARSGPTLRQAEWRDELLKTGIRGRNGQTIGFSRVEALGGTRFLHAEAETKEDRPKRVVISFGPDYAPLEQRQVESALEEASTLFPRPALVLFAAFQFDPEAAKDIDELLPERTGFTILKAQMNTDLLTEDLKKKRASNQSFWLIGQPDVALRQIKDGDNKGKWEVEIRGFDYYSPATGLIESGDTTKIAVWLLDPDYDGRSLFPRQVFFPLAGPNDGWARLAKSLRAEIDEERIEAYRGTVSLPFELGAHRRVAVKIVDDRGIESLRIIQAE
jgi:adenine-specific DNA-methyltransferase